jgi:hypothetical protein
MRVYLHVLEIQLGSERFAGQVGFSDQLNVGFNVLGRTDLFSRFNICFHEGQGFMTFERADQSSCEG